MGGFDGRFDGRFDERFTYHLALLNRQWHYEDNFRELCTMLHTTNNHLYPSPNNAMKKGKEKSNTKSAAANPLPALLDASSLLSSLL